MRGTREQSKLEGRSPGGGGGGTQNRFEMGCAAQASNPLSNLNGHFLEVMTILHNFWHTPEHFGKLRKPDLKYA